MLSVAALTTGHSDPSARFRVRQHIAPLAAEGIQVREFIPVIDKHAGVPTVISERTPGLLVPAVQTAWRYGKLAARLPGLLCSSSADFIWLNRELLPGRYSLERFLRKPIVLDVDDAVWRGRPDGARTMERLGREAAAVFAGNRYIAEWFAPYARNICIVPTAIDTDRFRPKEEPSCQDRPFTVGWTGTSGNFGYLEAVEVPLKRFLAQFGAKFLVVAEKPPKFSHLDPDQVEFVRWSPETEASTLPLMDVGLMPLPDTEWTRGKCSFKMLQYMSCGLPVVVSPVGMNAELLALGNIGFSATAEVEWFDALIWLYHNRSEREIMGRNGRTLVLERFSRNVVTNRIASAFRDLDSGKSSFTGIGGARGGPDSAM